VQYYFDIFLRKNTKKNKKPDNFPQKNTKLPFSYRRYVLADDALFGLHGLQGVLSGVNILLTKRKV